MQVFIRRSLSAFSGKRGAAVVAILWTVLIVSAAAWNIQSEWTVTLRLARAAALANYNKDLMYRRWAAGHGGVYAPITDQTPPNPYLANMPERDIFTPSGRALTLINPAYMTRQVYELSAEQYGVRGHITSLKPIRPENAPDEWERQALQAFETGQPEAAEVVVMDGTRYFRLMRPLITEERCMGCHAFQGYKVGDIRGGISVAVPLAIYDEVARAHVTSTILIAGLAWLVGLGGGLIVYQSWRRATINRERYQKALQESEARFRLLAENSTDMISRHDLQGVYLYASPACLALLGYKPEELVGHPAFEFIHPEDNPVVEQSRLSIINQPAAFTTTYRVRRKDGGYLWLETISHTLFDETGAPVEIHATSRDITERKRVEDALRESEILMRSAVEAASIVLFTLDTNGIFQLSTGAGLKSIGLKPGEVVGRSHFEIYKDLEFANTNVRLALQGETISFTMDAFNVIWDVTYAPLFDANNNIKGMVGTAVDITERKAYEAQILADQAELQRLLQTADESRLTLLSILEDEKAAQDEIQRLNDELEQRIAKRTAELEAANKDLESFSYSVSHDLRAPLRAMDGFSRILQSEYASQMPEDGRLLLERIRANALRMGELINDLLKFSRLGRQPLNTTLVNSTKIVQTALELLKSEREGRSVEIQIHELPDCQGDPSLLTQVWVNLLSNALKYSQKSTNPLIEVGYQTGATGETIYYVKDNGIGFDMRYANKLFGVFQRLHSEQEFKGTGVGLALAHRIITRHNGRIWAEAEPGKGAVFYFVLG